MHPEIPEVYPKCIGVCSWYNSRALLGYALGIFEFSEYIQDATQCIAHKGNSQYAKINFEHTLEYPKYTWILFWYFKNVL